MASSTQSSVIAARSALRLPFASVDGDAITAWSLAFAPVLYLALKNGGYDTVVSGQFGILAWWAVLLLALTGLLPRIRKAGWAGFGLLLALTAWTAVGISAALSEERALAEVARLATYAGVLGVALVLQARAGSRHLINGVACAIGLVTAMAVLSRLHPQWFPANDHIAFLESATRRLSYPLNYWNALAGFMAIGAVLLLGVSATARTKIGQGLAAAMLPVTGLGVFLTISRAGAVVFAVGVIAYLVLTDDRLPKILSALVAGAGTAILISAASQRDAVQSGIDSAAARSEGTEMIWLCLIVAAGVGALHVAINLLARHAQRPRWLLISRRQAWIGTAVAAPILIIVLFASGGANEVSDRWEGFKTPPEAAGRPPDSDIFARLEDSAGQGRYQYWEQAVDAYKTDKLTGIGGGSFGLWWAPHATVGGPVNDAHNLYVQTLAEVGWPGALLLLAFVVLTLLGGVHRTMRNSGDARVLIAAATAGILIFWVDATVEWIWQIAVMPVVLMILTAVVLGQRSPQRGSTSLKLRAVFAAVAILAFIPIALATTGAIKINQSKAAAQGGDLAGALAAARTAEDIQQGASTPKLQQALIYEQAGDLRSALPLAIAATEAEPQNWKPWIIRSRIEVRLGRVDEGLASFRKARSLNPQSAFFD